MHVQVPDVLPATGFVVLAGEIPYEIYRVTECRVRHRVSGSQAHHSVRNPTLGAEGGGGAAASARVIAWSSRAATICGCCWGRP